MTLLDMLAKRQMPVPEVARRSGCSRQCLDIAISRDSVSKKLAGKLAIGLNAIVTIRPNGSLDFKPRPDKKRKK